MLPRPRSRGLRCAAPAWRNRQRATWAPAGRPGAGGAVSVGAQDGERDQPAGLAAGVARPSAVRERDAGARHLTDPRAGANWRTSSQT